MSADNIMLAGRRILILERLINLKLGWRENAKDYAPWRLMNERQEELQIPEPILDIERMSDMVQGYYGLHGWGPSAGISTEEVLRELGLEEFAYES